MWTMVGQKVAAAKPFAAWNAAGPVPVTGGCSARPPPALDANLIHIKPLALSAASLIRRPACQARRALALDTQGPRR